MHICTPTYTFIHTFPHTKSYTRSYILIDTFSKHTHTCTTHIQIHECSVSVSCEYFWKAWDILSSPVPWMPSPWEPSVGRAALKGPLTLIGVWVKRGLLYFPSCVLCGGQWLLWCFWGQLGDCRWTLLGWLNLYDQDCWLSEVNEQFAFSCLITCSLPAEVYLMQTDHLSADFPPFQVFSCDT